MPISEAFVLALLGLSGSLWGGFDIYASEKVQAGISARIAEMEKKGKKVGRLRRKAANWPRLSLKIASRFWGIASILFVVELTMDSASQYVSYLPDIDGYLFLGGLVAVCLAAIETGNVKGFVSDFMFKPALSALETARWALISVVTLAAVLDALLADTFLWNFAQQVWFVAAFGLLQFPAMAGAVIYIARVHQDKRDWLYHVGLLLFFSPYLYLFALGIMIRLGVHM